MSWSLDAHDLDLLAVQADERLLTAVGARRQVEVADPVIAVLAALAREVDAKPVPTDPLAGLRLVGQPAAAGRRANRRAALTGVAAAVAVLSIGGVAAAVGGTPVSSVIRETVGSVFDGGSGPSTADLVSAKLGDANAALARGDAQQAKQILEEIQAQVEGSDPGELPASLVEQVKQLESRVDAVELPPSAPAVTSSPSPLVPAGTNGGEASQPADSEATGNGKGNGTNQGQGQEKHEDGATPTSEPTSAPEPSDPADPSPSPSPDPTPSPSSNSNDHTPHGKSPKQDSNDSAQAVSGPAAATSSTRLARGKLPPGSQGQHKGVQKPRADQAESQEAAEQAAPMTGP
ncbi:MAG TPA: hypothetical protein VGK55_10655 [Actinomycetes bacterium]